MSAASEYLPGAHENGNGHHNGNGNGHSNGHAKIFSLKPATDPDTLAILEARNQALSDRRLTRSMRGFVCWLIDRALNPRWFDCKGVVCVADSIPAEVFGVTERSVYDWKKRVAECGYFWLSKKPKSNMWPLTVYHMTCLHRPRQEGKTDADGTYGGSRMRQAPGDDVAAQGRETRNAALNRKRAERLLPLQGGIAAVPGSPAREAGAENTNLQRFSAVGRSEFRLSAEENFGSEPKSTSARSRNEFRPGAEASFGSEPKPVSAESRSQLPSRAEAGCRHIETQKEGKKLLETVPKASTRLGTPTRAVAATVEKQGRGAMKGLQALAAKALEEKPPEPCSRKEFLVLCESTFGAAEMNRNGGLWTLRWREDVVAAVASLMETRATKREGVVPLQRGKTWAAYCTDIYQRLRKKPARV